MKVGGIILIVLGGILALLGFAVNSNPDMQLVSFISGHGENPGTPLIVIGVIAIVVGVVLIVLKSKKSKEK
jgi:hypothetical protein